MSRFFEHVNYSFTAFNMHFSPSGSAHECFKDVFFLELPCLCPHRFVHRCTFVIVWVTIFRENEMKSSFRKQWAFIMFIKKCAKHQKPSPVSKSEQLAGHCFGIRCSTITYGCKVLVSANFWQHSVYIFIPVM